MPQNWKFFPKFQNKKIEIKNIGQEWISWIILNFASLFVVLSTTLHVRSSWKSPIHSVLMFLQFQYLQKKLKPSEFKTCEIVEIWLNHSIRSPRLVLQKWMCYYWVNWIVLNFETLTITFE
jgi:hypothetical protein